MVSQDFRPYACKGDLADRGSGLALFELQGPRRQVQDRTSHGDRARRHYEDIDAAHALADVKVPTAIIAAAQDTIIPPERTAALRPSIAKLVFDRTIGSAGHNDIYQRLEFRTAMDEALAAVTSPGR